ncbi:hypothetical protein ACHAQA_009393 [Verticillium albo-atrum]
MLLLAFLTTAILAFQASASCYANECQQALFPCSDPEALASGTEFCATVTAYGTTATNYPDPATKVCGQEPSEYVTACACGSSCALSRAVGCPSTKKNIIPNGGFECGLESWILEINHKAASGSVVKKPYAGAKAFEARFEGGSYDGHAVRIGSPDQDFVKYTPLRFKFHTFFDSKKAGFLALRVNGKIHYTVDAVDKGWGAWKANTVKVTPEENYLRVQFEWHFFDGVKALGRLDLITVEYV